MIVGALLVGVGIWLVGAYVVGVFEVLDEADRSWIFWGLGLAAFAIPAVTIGTGLMVCGWFLRGRIHQTEERRP